jgi:hypothetical protein
MTTVAGATHPILQGVPYSFTYTFDGFSSGDLFPYNVDQPLILMTSNSGGPAVTVRQLTPGGAGGTGRVVNFAWAANYFGGQQNTLGQPEVQKLYINAVRWVR